MQLVVEDQNPAPLGRIQAQPGPAGGHGQRQVDHKPGLAALARGDDVGRLTPSKDTVDDRRAEFGVLDKQLLEGFVGRPDEVAADGLATADMPLGVVEAFLHILVGPRSGERFEGSVGLQADHRLGPGQVVRDAPAGGGKQAEGAIVLVGHIHPEHRRQAPPHPVIMVNSCAGRPRCGSRGFDGRGSLRRLLWPQPDAQCIQCPLAVGDLRVAARPDVARDCEVAGAVVEFQPADARRVDVPGRAPGTIGLAAPQEDLEARPRGADLGVRRELPQDLLGPGGDRIAGVEAVVQVDAAERVVRREHEPHAVVIVAVAERPDRLLERRPGARIGGTGLAAGRGVVRHLRGLAIAGLSPPDDPLGSLPETRRHVLQDRRRSTLQQCGKLGQGVVLFWLTFLAEIATRTQMRWASRRSCGLSKVSGGCRMPLGQGSRGLGGGEQ